MEHVRLAGTISARRSSEQGWQALRQGQMRVHTPDAAARMDQHRRAELSAGAHGRGGDRATATPRLGATQRAQRPSSSQLGRRAGGPSIRPRDHPRARQEGARPPTISSRPSEVAKPRQDAQQSVRARQAGARRPAAHPTVQMPSAPAAALQPWWKESLSSWTAEQSNSDQAGIVDKAQQFEFEWGAWIRIRRGWIRIRLGSSLDKDKDG